MITIPVIDISKILLEQIDFWKFPEQLKLKEAMKMYPPRFKIAVNGRGATERVTVQFKFTGADRRLCFSCTLDPTTLGACEPPKAVL